MTIYDLYKQLRNMPVFRSKEYLNYLHKEYGCFVHHLTGSQGSQKLNDYLALPLESQGQHDEAEKNKAEFCIENLAKTLTILFKYIQKLEETK